MDVGDFSWREVGERIRHRRIARGFSQQHLAATARLTQAAIYRLERGDTNPQINTLRQIAGALDCTTRDLMCGYQFDAPELAGRVGRVRAIVESGDEGAITVLDHGIQAAESLLQRAGRSRAVPNPQVKRVIKGQGREGPPLPSLWNKRPVLEESEADDIIKTSNPEFMKIGERTIRRSKART